MSSKNRTKVARGGSAKTRGETRKPRGLKEATHIRTKGFKKNLAKNRK